MKVLVAGATGLIGREVAGLLKVHGHYVRTLSRHPDRAAALRNFVDDVRVVDAREPLALDGVCDGVDVIISALGAPVSPSSSVRASYLETDLVANAALLKAARSAHVRRMVYVSVHSESSYEKTRYLQAHIAVEQALRTSGLEYGIVRPTGVFGAFAEMLPMARIGLIPLIDAGTARTNPVHELDLAAVVVAAALGSDTAAEIDVGGPEILSRRNIAELAFHALGRTPRFFSTPPGVMRVAARAMRVFNPRLSDFMTFIILASTHDCMAPAHGEQQLGPYLRAKALPRD